MKELAPSKPAEKHGCVSARRWKDLRQAARLARTEGVTLIMHGITISPLSAHGGKENRQPAGNGEKAKTMRDTKAHQQTESDAPAPATVSKRQQRSLQRLAQFNETKQAAQRFERWSAFIQRAVARLLHRDRVKLRDQVWTDWMRSRTPSASGSPPQVSPSASKPVLTPEPGSCVRISGLQARTDLNHQVGTAGAYDEAKQRCEVRLPLGEYVAIKPANLEVIPQSSPSEATDEMADAWRAALENPSSGKRKSRNRRSRAKRP